MHGEQKDILASLEVHGVDRQLDASVIFLFSLLSLSSIRTTLFLAYLPPDVTEYLLSQARDSAGPC